MYVCMYVCVYVYMSIERERGRERETESELEREREREHEMSGSLHPGPLLNLSKKRLTFPRTPCRLRWKKLTACVCGCLFLYLFVHMSMCRSIIVCTYIHTHIDKHTHVHKPHKKNQDFSSLILSSRLFRHGGGQFAWSPAQGMGI